MNKKMKKIISALLTVAMVCTMASCVCAANLTPALPTNGTLTNMTQKVLGIVQFFGYAMAVGMLLYIGIKYMMASANEKADLKKGSINYVIGAIIVAAAATIVGMFQGLASEISVT